MKNAVKICLAILFAGLWLAPAAWAQPQVYWKHSYTTYDFTNETITFSGQVINNSTNLDIVSVDKRTLKFIYRLTPNGQQMSKTLDYNNSRELAVPAKGAMRYYFRVKMPKGFNRESEVIKVTLDFKYTTAAHAR